MSVTLEVKQLKIGNLVTWQLSPELTAGMVEIERSTTENNFSVVGKVILSAAGSNSFIDIQPGINQAKYRIKVIKEDGDIIYSMAEGLVRQEANQLMVSSFHFENTTGLLSLNLEIKEEGILLFRLLDYKGNEEIAGEQYLYLGTNDLQIDLNQFPATAIYQLELLLGTEKEVITFSKEKNTSPSSKKDMTTDNNRN